MWPVTHRPGQPGQPTEAAPGRAGTQTKRAHLNPPFTLSLLSLPSPLLPQVEKSPKPVASCAMPAAPGMVIKTDTPLVKKAREGVMEFLLVSEKRRERGGRERAAGLGPLTPRPRAPARAPP